MKLEPVAWHVKDKTDFFTMWKPIARQWILDGFDVVEMFPAIPEGYVVVPKEAKPTMQEIEGLVYKLEAAVETSVLFDKATNVLAMQEARAALMAAIRQLSNSTQDGE